VCAALTVTEIATICGCVQFGHSSICAHVNQKTISNKSDNIMKRAGATLTLPVTHTYTSLYSIFSWFFLPVRRRWTILLDERITFAFYIPAARSYARYARWRQVITHTPRLPNPPKANQFNFSAESLSSAKGLGEKVGLLVGLAFVRLPELKLN